MTNSRFHDLRRPFAMIVKAAGVVFAFAVGLLAVCLLFPLTDRLLPGRDVRGRVQVRWFRGLCRVLGVAVRADPIPGPEWQECSTEVTTTHFSLPPRGRARVGASQNKVFGLFDRPHPQTPFASLFPPWGEGAKPRRLKVVSNRVPGTAGGRLWIANHISWLDVVVLGAQTPLTFIAKSEIAAWPVVGLLARLSGMLFVERGRPSRSGGTVASMGERLRRGETLLLFPEGTTTRGKSVARFHSSLFQAALDAAAPVVPVAVSYRGSHAEIVPFVGDDAFVPHLWRLLGARGIEVHLAAGPCLTGAADREHLARQARESVRGLLLQVQPSGGPWPETASSEGAP